MALIKSISGIRGTIGGLPGSNLTPLDVVRSVSAYGVWQQRRGVVSRKIVVGRDARISGTMVENLVVSSLVAMGFDVVKIGMASTPTTEFAVINEQADGGIIITASHNPKHWNALKLLNNEGEFLSDHDGKEIMQIADSEHFTYADIDHLGHIFEIDDYDDKHINMVLSLDLVDVAAIKSAGFRVVVDGVNSVGGVIVPKLLSALGVEHVTQLFCEADGDFRHNPEPIPENLTEISRVAAAGHFDVGFVVDPDVDRLAIICDDGSMFGEEYTLVAVADYVLSHTRGNTVSNLSSTRALSDITRKYGCNYAAAAVGEVNVVAKMKETHAIIGGEGNGGVIYPAAHYGRDAIVGIALFLSLMAQQKRPVRQIKQSLPQYFISKNKIRLSDKIDVDTVFSEIAKLYADKPQLTIDGLKIEFPETKEWVHLRKSNTEPIIRIYSESENQMQADKIAADIMKQIERLTV